MFPLLTTPSVGRELSLLQTQKEGGKDERCRGGRPVLKGPEVQAQAESPQLCLAMCRVWGVEFTIALFLFKGGFP